MIITHYLNPNYKYLFESITTKPFVRSQKVAHAYLELLDKLKKENIKVEDYTKDKIFRGSERIVITENEYPYQLPSILRHDVLWALEDYTEEDILQQVEQYYRDEIIVAVFTNKFTLQSVRKIKHCHIFVDKKETL